jgi:hypothetical protein
VAGIGTADVTYTVKNLRTLANSRKHNRIQLAFGDGALTYSAGGIPLVIGKLGCPTVVESLTVVEQSTSGYKFQYDSTNNKLIVMQPAGVSHSHAVIIASNAGTAGTQAVNATTALGLFNSGAAVTVAAQAGTLGGVSATTPTSTAMAEATSVALAAQTIICEVIGW